MVTAVFVILFPLLPYSNLSVQKIFGKAYESSSHIPVSNGTILALNNENKVYDITRSDSLGSFHFDNLKLGSFKIQTHRYGYADIMAGPFSFNNNDTLIMKIELDPQPIALNSISITAKHMERYLANRGFYDRKKWGMVISLHKRILKTK